MASIALFAVGSAVGGGVGGAGPVAFGLTGAQLGGAIGGLLGSVIDQQFLFAPKQADVKGPRINDYQLQTANEGAPLRYDMGPENKHTGNVIWVGMHDGKPFEERSSKKKIGGKGGSGGSQTTYSYYADVAVALCEGPVYAVRRIWADSKLIYATGTNDTRYEGLTLYTGSEDVPDDTSMTANTSPSSHIEAFEGSGFVPKYKGVCYFVLDSLELSDFGNRIPNFSALVESDFTMTVAEAIGELCERAGLTALQYDTSRVPHCLWGYSFTGPLSMARALEPIMTAYDLVAQESGGKIHFFQRGDEVSRTVVSTDMAATGEGADTEYPLQLSQIISIDLPSEVNVNYIDANADYGQGEQKAQRINFETTNVEIVDVPLVLRPKFAASLAKRRLFRAYVERLRATVRLPYSYIAAQEADVLLVTFEGETYRLLVEEVDRGENGILEYKCVVQDVSAGLLEEEQSDDSHVSTSTQTPYTAPSLEFEVMEIPSLVDSHALRPGLYFSAALDPATTYRGAGLYVSSTDVTADYALSQAMPPLGVIGTTLSALQAPGTAAVWDKQNILVVSVTGGTLSSVSETDVLNGENWAVVGDEVIGYTTATLLSTGRYTLSGLLRGARHTERFMSTHVAGERFVSLDTDIVGFEENSSPEIGTTRYHRAVPTGGSIGDYTTESELLDGDTVKCFSPSHVTGSRDGSDNLTIDWYRRTRSPSYDVFSPVIAPNLAGQEKYEIDILSGTGGSVVRTITVSDATTTSYTAAEQTTDGLTPGDPVFMILYQIDSTYGRGFPTEELSV